MRGKGVIIACVDLVSRITPAYAGKSSPIDCSIPQYQDHPRLCGEKSSSLKNNKIGLGSPPPMRGKVHIVVHTVAIIRITPAYAGKRLLTICDGNDIEDHPRLCGEKFHNAYNSPLRLGSPPPMRGKAFIIKIVENN